MSEGARVRQFSRDGLTFDVLDEGPVDGSPVVLLHGFPTSSLDFAGVVDRLAERRRVVLLDLLGYGLSEKPDLHYKLSLQADLVVALSYLLFLGAIGISGVQSHEDEQIAAAGIKALTG
mgnify:CR=1 FL=1